MTVSIQELAQRSDIKFGTSGLRGLVENLTDEVCFAYTKAFLLSQETTFKKVAIGHDLRPSSPQITLACIAAIESQGLEAIYLGALPTPAVAYYCLNKKIPGVVVTGSHIPFDRNGIKFYKADGEISKADEESIMGSRIEIEGHNLSASLPAFDGKAIELYQKRYIDFFGTHFLSGKIIAIYQHSSVARDFLNHLFQAMGAKTLLLGRSNEFIPIDTEAVRDKDIKQAEKWAKEYDFDMLVSTDGDADRPLIADENGEFFRGDILGILAAQYLHAEHVVTPVNSNTAVELANAFKSVRRTKIGSPFVVEGMKSINKEASHEVVVGFEANGGFMQQTRIIMAGMELNSLPTRDAVLPMLALVGISKAQKIPMSALIGLLPKRFTQSTRLENVSDDEASSIMSAILKNTTAVGDFLFKKSIKIIEVNTVDGLRILFDNQAIVHFRQSGNSPEMRIYAEASSIKAVRSIICKAMAFVKSYLDMRK